MKKIKGLIYAIISAITFGLIPMFAVPVLKAGNLDTISVLFYRFLLGTIIMGFFALIGKKSFKIKRKELLALSLFGLNYTITALGLLYSYNMIPSGIATTIHSLYPITVTLFAVIFFREKISYKTVLAIVGSIVGVFMMCWAGGATNIWGIALVSITVLTYTNYILLMSKSKVKSLDPMILNFYVLLFGSILVYAIAPFTEAKGISIITTKPDLINLILLALIPTVVSNIMLIMAVKVAGATKTAIMGSFEPATAIAVGVVYFHESINHMGIMGFVLILISTIFVIIYSKKSNVH